MAKWSKGERRKKEGKRKKESLHRRRGRKRKQLKEAPKWPNIKRGKRGNGVGLHQKASFSFSSPLAFWRLRKEEELAGKWNENAK